MLKSSLRDGSSGYNEAPQPHEDKKRCFYSSAACLRCGGWGPSRFWHYKHGGWASIFPKKCLRCVASVTKQFCRFHLHLSSLPPSLPPAQPVTLHFLFGGSFIHCWAWPKTSCHNCCYLRAIRVAVLADNAAQDFCQQVVDSWDPTDALPVLDLSLKEAASKNVCDMTIPVTPLIIVTPSCKQLLISTVWRRLWGTNSLYSALK